MGDRRNKARRRVKHPVPRKVRPGKDTNEVNADRHRARVEQNWRVISVCEEVIALEPGREHEQVFDGGVDPFWEAVQFAARCLRGETEPGALPSTS